MNIEVAHAVGPFWRQDTPLSNAELSLLELLHFAHARSALRNNASSDAVFLSSAASGDYSKAIAAALMTLGGSHAPIEETMRLLSDPEPVTAAIVLLARGLKVPGWGNSFVRGEPDPIWAPVDRQLQSAAPELFAQIRSITATIHRHGKTVFPNPSVYTAAVALTVGLPANAATYLFLVARLEAWTALYLRHRRN